MRRKAEWQDVQPANEIGLLTARCDPLTRSCCFTVNSTVELQSVGKGK